MKFNLKHSPKLNLNSRSKLQNKIKLYDIKLNDISNPSSQLPRNKKTWKFHALQPHHCIIYVLNPHYTQPEFRLKKCLKVQ